MAHLTKEQRYTISVMKNKGFSYSKISEIIRVHKSTIGRELKRNCDKRNSNYCSDLAHRKYMKRQKQKPRYLKFTLPIQQTVEELLREDYSPEQVVGVLKRDNKETVSHERIYQHIWGDKAKKGTLYTHLRRQGRKYKKRGAKNDNRGIIKNRISIDKRPEVVDKRERFGDLEVDLIMGKNHKYAILTANDRASGMVKMKKVNSKHADEITCAIIQLLEDWMPYLHTMTADNGKEFAGHQTVAQQLNIQYFFAHPYHSWERGSNENLNGLIRQYFKKGTCFKSITDEQIITVQNKLNNRPRKRFNYQTPIFAMNNLLFNNKVAFVT
jgi:IS30 family transposase